jgi:hypothetical protein
MKKMIVVCLLLVAGVLSVEQLGRLGAAAAPAPSFETIPANVTFYENDAELLPTSTADVVTGTIWLEEITLTNNSSSDVTVRIRDKQTTPRQIVPDDMVVLAKHVYTIQFKARKCPGGVTWLASDGTNLIGTIRGKRVGP